jgi:hypothetical protein
MHLYPRLVFPSIKQFFKELLLGLMEKTKTIVCVVNFNKMSFCNYNFDLWMSKDGHNNFASMINFLRAT